MVTSTKSEDLVAKRSWLGTRIFSMAALCAAVSGVGYLGQTAYRVATDSFVVPIVLSPDSDLVIQSKLSRSALLNEQMKITLKKDQLDAELEAAAQAVVQLEALHASASNALEWTSSVTATQAMGGYRDGRALALQRTEIASMIAAQEVLVGQMKSEVATGLATKTDYSREQLALGQMRIAALDNDRAKVVSDVQLSQVRLTQRALSGGGGGARIATPEMLLQQDQLVRIQCDLLKLQAERRAKTAERRQIEEERAKLDELLAQLNRRPIFRALDASTNVAFVPYSQLDGVRSGGNVYECVVGVFSCTSVGRVTEVLPGEVIVPDPWGTLARGQYVVIELDDQHAAQSKTLRVRGGGASALAAKPADPSKRVASK